MPATNLDVSSFLLTTNVTGMKPAIIVEHIFGVFGFVEVSHHDVARIQTAKAKQLFPFFVAKIHAGLLVSQK